ncbi:MAG: hypothetical protein NC223_08175 [Butyrivibrio sp.]|nr:hypothetical protein [Butyrivibrio sp.]
MERGEGREEEGKRKGENENENLLISENEKCYDIYMIAGANKFLRIYYGRVKEYLASLPEVEET